MIKKRLISVLIISDGKVVQTKNFKHTNVIHYDPYFSIEAMGKWSIDELVIINANKENDKKNFLNLVKRISKFFFLPLTVGGWVNSLQDARQLLSSGADKILINTSFYKNPNFIKRFVSTFGSQCLVASVDAKKVDNEHIAFIDRCNVSTGINVVKWCKILQNYGAGEIFLNSYEHDGGNKGYNLKIYKKIHRQISVPLIYFGGVGNWIDLYKGLKFGADAVAAANIFHYSENSATFAKDYLKKKKINIRS